MDDPLQELENELKSLRPRRVSPDLLARIEQELPSENSTAQRARSTNATPWSAWKWAAGWSLAAAAMMLGIFVTVKRSLPSPEIAPQEQIAASPVTRANKSTAENSTYKPVAAASVLYDLKDEGSVELSDNTPARRMRYRYVDTYTWKNPASNASLKWSVPRDEVRVIPASLH